MKWLQSVCLAGMILAGFESIGQEALAGNPVREVVIFEQDFRGQPLPAGWRTEPSGWHMLPEKLRAGFPPVRGKSWWCAEMDARFTGWNFRGTPPECPARPGPEPNGDSPP